MRKSDDDDNRLGVAEFKSTRAEQTYIHTYINQLHFEANSNGTAVPLCRGCGSWPSQIIHCLHMHAQSMGVAMGLTFLGGIA